MDNDKYIGRLLDNRYEIQEVIGIGGMAVVYKARCHRLNRLVAIKILKDEYSKDEDFRRRFHAEGQAVAMLSHPNIVSVYDVSTTNEADYIVMELIDGISLKQYMEKKGVLNWKETLHFAIQIAKALEHAHGRGIVHRDIKPHNVMVLKNGSVKVADFGIARVMSKSNTLTKEALGSVHYISPEQAKGGRVDNRSNLYSLGVVMYEMMTGRPPYDGETPVAVAIQHINGGAKMPSILNPNIPGGLEQIIMKAMAQEPAGRYVSATAMLHDMDEFRKLPSLLFDYNMPPLDEVTRLQPKTQPAVIPAKPPTTTAERVAAGKPGQSSTRRQNVPRHPANQRSNSYRTPSPSQRTTSARRRREAREAREEENRSKIATIAVVACSLVAIIAIGIFLFTLFNGGMMGQKPDYVEVPTLIGKTYEQALSYSGDFEIKVRESVYDPEYAKNYVNYQNPMPGDKVVKGTRITITVSLGPEPKIKTMDDLVDMVFADAKTFLDGQKLDLHILPREENSDTIAAGKVTRTEPAKGEPLEEGQTVTIWVSLGPVIKTARMPNVVGQNIATALQVLTNAGFDNIDYSEYVDSDEDKDEVVFQSVTRNEVIPVNTPIVLKLSNGPTLPPETTVPPTTVPPTTVPPTVPPETTVPTTLPQPDPVTKTVTFKLPDGMVEHYVLTIQHEGAVIFTQTIKDGVENVDVTLTGNGQHYYELYINDMYFTTEKVDFDAT